MADFTRVPLDTAFDIDFADKIAHFETFNKHQYRPNTYLHKWWGRRCGSTFRLILKGLVEPEGQRGYYAPGGLEGKVILDPMLGGGTTLHEAIRMGASVIGADIDPVPILQARATLSAVPLSQLETYFEMMLSRLRAEFALLYRSHCPDCGREDEFQHMIYGLRRRCHCREVVAVDSLLLRAESGGRTFRLCPACESVIIEDPAVRSGHQQPHVCHATGRAAALVERSETRCAHCGDLYSDRQDLPFYQRYVPLVAFGQCAEHGFYYRPVDDADRARVAAADGRRDDSGLSAADFAIVPGDKSIQLLNRGVSSYLDVFGSRQLLVLNRAIDLLPEDPAARLNLGMLLSTSTEFNSMLCGYKGASRRRPGAVRHTFAHHAYSFPYTALETNPLNLFPASGTLRNLFDTRIARGRKWALLPQERLVDGPRRQFTGIAGERDEGTEVTTASDLTGKSRHFFLHQGSSIWLPVEAASVDAVVTDPPYFDSIQYSDLAAFFRVWLRRMFPAGADWDYDVNGSAVDPERAGFMSRYAELLGGIFRECGRVLRPNSGRLVFTFHHWKPDAWAALTQALHGAGFALVNRYVVHAEHTNSVHISNVRALTHDVVLVCAPVASGRAAPWSLPEAVSHQDSRSFCLGCGDVVGWCLNRPELDAAAIRDVWDRVLG